MEGSEEDLDKWRFGRVMCTVDCWQLSLAVDSCVSSGK